jgi:hypothetical protein
VTGTLKNKALVLGAGVFGSGLCVLTGQQPASSGVPTSVSTTIFTSVFTQAQAEAGRNAYENTCGKCHTPTLLGRKGDPGELPPVGSLPAYMQEMASGPVPPLAGADFMGRWGSRTTAALTERINQAVGAFPPEGTNIPVPGHAPAESDPTAVNITAWVLQVNGARAGTVPLTKTTATVVRSITVRPITADQARQADAH